MYIQDTEHIYMVQSIDTGYKEKILDTMHKYRIQSIYTGYRA